MTRDSTLDEFLGGGSDDAGVDGDAGDDDTARVADPTPDGDDGRPDADGDDAPSVAAAEPADVTFEWTPGGAACEACGATVERRWADGDARVCADCKEW